MVSGLPDSRSLALQGPQLGGSRHLARWPGQCRGLVVQLGRRE
jgi:hypothetical protein